jgi:DNA topoisomerase IB
MPKIIEHRVDFCAECDEFPCQKAKDFFAAQNWTGEDWKTGSRRIIEVGADAYLRKRRIYPATYVIKRKQNN